MLIYRKCWSTSLPVLPRIWFRYRDEAARPASVWDVAQDAGIMPSYVETERRLNAPIKLLAISPKTRLFYQTYRWQGRYRTLRHWLFIVGLLNMICGLFDYFILDTALFEITIVGRIIASATFVLGGLGLYRLRRPEIEGLTVLLPCTVLFLVAGSVGLHSSPELLERYIVNAWFVVGSGIVFLRLDFLYTCILTLISLLILPLFIFASGIHPGTAKAEIIFFYSSAMCALWNAQRIQLAHRYRGILLSLKNELQAKQLGEQALQLRNLVEIDQLTGIANRGCFNAACSDLADDVPIAIVMLDIDRFKILNDSLGHVEGDRAICAVAGALRDNVRDGDLVARYGGEEFVVLARGATALQAYADAECMRVAVAALPSVTSLTISAGVAAGLARDQITILKRADAALYEAKHQGRNRVIMAGEPMNAAEEPSKRVA